MNYETKWAPIFITLILGSILIFAGIMKGVEERKLEEAKEETSQTIDKLLDALENTVVGSESNTEPNAVEWETIVMNVSAYCPCEICCNGWSQIPVSSGKRKTASGHIVKEGDKFIAAPKNYNFGTEMIIPGYNKGRIVKVRDRGGAIKGNKLDVYFDTHQEALQFGRQEYHPVKVKIK